MSSSSTSQPSQTPTPGSANNSSWNASPFAFAPNTNTLDKDSMPSDQAQVARDKSAQIMAAVKAGDMERANALMGKDQTGGKLMPGVGWIKRKLNKRPSGKVEGVEVPGEAGEVDLKGVGKV